MKKGEITIISWPLHLHLYTLHLKVTEPEVTLAVSKFPQITLPRPLTLSGHQYESGSAEGNPVPRVMHRTPSWTSMSYARGKHSVLRCYLGRGPFSKGHPSCFPTLHQTQLTGKENAGHWAVNTCSVDAKEELQEVEANRVHLVIKAKSWQLCLQ